MFQSVEKDEATQAIICTILSASNTSLWRLLLKGFYGGAGGRGSDLGWRRWEETLLYGVQRFFPGGLWDSCGGAVPPMTVCLPVRMGTVSA